ncbi:MAG: hypothetical protein ACRBBW_20510 [Cellvibrionaceae bacterium]
MSLAPGTAEFNDATAILRGDMVLGQGTFSGEFSSQNIAAVNTLNIRDGAASSFYAFSSAGATDVTFTVPAQAINTVSVLHIPLLVFGTPDYAEDNTNFYTYRRTLPTSRIRFYRQGSLVLDFSPTKFGDAWQNSFIFKVSPQGVGFRYTDFAGAATPVTYRILCTKTDGTATVRSTEAGGALYDWDLSGTCEVNGPIVTEFRKK